MKEETAMQIAIASNFVIIGFVFGFCVRELIALWELCVNYAVSF